MFEGLLEAIEAAETITIFRHINADMDALGSQYGLKQWILENYPTKSVYALGHDRNDNLFDPIDEIDDLTIQNSLAIVLDCASQARVDDQRFLTAKKIIAIDHHPFQDDFMDREYRLVHYAATCEILTEFFMQSQKGISKSVATCLYRGLLTDTCSFKTNNTTAHTLQTAATLCETGIDIVGCNQDVFDVSRKEFEFATFLRSKAVIEDCGLVWCRLESEDCERFHLSPSQAKEQVFQFQNVRGFEIWCVFTEAEHGLYEGSLRSRKITINQISSRYHGGGHACACGVKNLNRQDLEACLQDLRNLLIK